MEKRKEGVGRQRFIIVVSVIALGEISISNPFLWIKIYGSNHLIRRGIVRVIAEINFDLVLKSCPTAVPVDHRFRASQWP